jgi:hypothetical protein
MELHVLAISEDGHEQTGGGGDCDRDINEVAFNDFVAVDDGVDDGVLFEGKSGSLQEKGHETQLNVVFLQEIFSQFLTIPSILPFWSL